jgi:hypothetical protein
VKQADESWIKPEPALALSGTVTLLGARVNMTVSHDGETATITISGPASKWFGVAFDATQMSDLPYALIVNGNGSVMERKLASHAPGIVLTRSVRVESSTVVRGGTRVVTLSRPVVGKTANHYTLPTKPNELNMLAAIGTTDTFVMHASQGGGTLMLVTSRADACVCAPHSRDLFAYGDEPLTTWTNYNCVDEPRSDMLRRGDGMNIGVQNNACDMMTYHGGLRCCKHTWFLTDKKQAAETTRPQVDVYYLKWRFYFQEYIPVGAINNNNAASHLHLRHWVFLIDLQVNDYEEWNTPARYGVESVANITAHLTVDTMGFDGNSGEGPIANQSWSSIQTFVTTPHCHAPSCIREELYNGNTLVCNVTAKYGDRKYGSTNATFNEADYVAIPPCIFGHQPGFSSPLR